MQPPFPVSDLLVLTFGRNLVAVHASTGQRMWSLALPNVARRLFRTGARLMVVTFHQVLCVDLASGTLIGSVELPFDAQNGLSDGSHLYLSGTNGAARIDESGRLSWAIARAGHDQLLNFDLTLTCKGEDGRELWRFAPGTVLTPAALVLGDRVAQPDFS
ncbi:MAG: PQQ-binding-like beta-propeller repeat protein [Polyangiaceae bacterium]